jgi:CBS domain-containing protein
VAPSVGTAEAMMRAKDIMTTQVVTATADAPVTAVAALLLQHHISGLPVVDPAGHVVGMIGESDLLHRIAAQAKSRRSWWRALFPGPGDDPAEFVKIHGMRAANVMTSDVITVSEDTSVEEIARLTEERKIRRVPVVRDRKLIGVVSRADLLRVMVATSTRAEPPSLDDQALRERVAATIAQHHWAHITQLNVVVTSGTVHLSGLIGALDREALRVLVESVPGVKAVEDHLTRLPARLENY